MSEEERIKRFSYREKRKKLIGAISIVLIIFTLITVALGTLSFIFNKTYYVNYTERSSVDYGVHLKENDFYEDDFLGEDYAYIASLIDKIEASFNYGISMEEAAEVSFKYTYRIDSILEIKDRNTQGVVYAPVFNEVAEQEKSVLGKDMSIKQTVFLNYAKYDELAKSFISVYKLRDAQATLRVNMYIDVVGESESFHENEASKSYVSSISVPLATDTLAIKITSSAPSVNQRILSYTTKDIAASFKNYAIYSAITTLILSLILAIYTLLSRNHDITYDIKIKRLVSAYRSFIQKIKNAFNTEGYQELTLSSFKEMLEIRDTIQSPILMFENEDRTATKFYIPTNTSLLYTFEIKVDDYDEIYKATDDGAPPCDGDTTETADEVTADEVIAETVIVAEETTEDVVAEDVVAVEEAVELTEDTPPTHKIPSEMIDSIIENIGDPEEEDAAIAYVDENGNVVKISCARSFTANLIQSNPEVKYYYSELKNHILSYKGTKSRTSWRIESFNKGRIQLFKLKIRGKTICLYCALNPDDYDVNKYHQERAMAKNFAKVPMMVRIKSERGLKRAKVLIEEVMRNHSLTRIDGREDVDYSAPYPYETTKSLVERGLIKILVPGAVAAEPKPHHHEYKKVFEVVKDGEVDEIILFEVEGISEDDIAEIIESPTPTLESIDYDDASEDASSFDESAEHPGVDVIGVVWPERPSRNKIYRYDPDGEVVAAGDIVIVPTFDAHRGREVIRKAVVAHENHKVDSELLHRPLKKIIGVVNREKLPDTK